MITVRKATLADLSEIVALGARWHADGSTYDGIPYNSVIARRTVKRCMTDADARVWVAVRDGRIVGFLIGEIGQMPFSHHESATDLAFVAYGGGNKLIEVFLSWCRLRNVARVDMGVSASRPHPAINRLFRRAGLAEAGGLFFINLIGGESAKAVA